jgi:hypothetical protein
LIRASDGLAGATVLAALFSTAVAHAQGGAATDPALAETLFRDGKTLMSRGDYASACPKFAESERLDPGTGTLMALAYCHEHEGKLASAWAEYTAVQGAARQAGQVERVKVASERIASIEPRLSRMVVRVAPSTPPRKGFEVLRDGIVLGEAAWGESVPIDPGEHVVEARAPGWKSWSVIEHARPGAVIEVVVPKLEAESPAPSAVVDSSGAAGGSASASPDSNRAAETVPTASRGNTGRVVGLGLVAAGVATLGVGVYFGVRTFQKRDDANALCPVGQPCTNPDAITSNDDAHTSALVSTITTGVGIAAVGGGIYLLLTSKSAASSSAAKPSPTVSPLVGAHAFGLACGTAW